MTRLYYDKDTGYLCNRYPKDIKVKEDSPFIEIEDEELEKTYCCLYGEFWAVIDGKLQIVEDKEVTSSKEYKKYVITNQMADKQAFMNDTDYIIAKLNELLIEEDETYEETKAQYKETLDKRRQVRKELNDLQEELKKLDEQ